MTKYEKHKETMISEELIDEAYRKLMPQTPDARVELAAAAVYTLIKSSKDFLTLEEAINAYSTEAERRGFRAGLILGLTVSSGSNLLKALKGAGAGH